MNGKSSSNLVIVPDNGTRKNKENLSKLLTLLLLMQRVTSFDNPKDVQQQSADNFGRIVNGELVDDIEEMPFIVKLHIHEKINQLKDDEDEADQNDMSICGGSILDKHNVLTAAHCVASRNIIKVEVIAGATYINREEISKKRVIVKTVYPKDIICHFNYNGIPEDGDDIAILTLKKNPFDTIVNGELVDDIEEMPFIVKLHIHEKINQLKDDEDEADQNDMSICGGSILDKHNVLTAAHCVASRNIIKVEVIAGATYINREEISKKRVIVKTVYPKDIICHFNYNGIPEDGDDIAILTLKKNPFNIGRRTKRIKPTVLPTTKSLKQVNRTACRVAGWQDTKNCVKSRNLREASWIPWLSDDECYESLGRDYISNKMICAGYSKWRPAGKISCQEDSGSPYVCWNRKEGTYVQVGVVSWGYGCNRRWNLSLYVRVDNYIKWIDRTKYMPQTTTRRPRTTRKRKNKNKKDQERPVSEYKTFNDRHDNTREDEDKGVPKEWKTFNDRH